MSFSDHPPEKERCAANMSKCLARRRPEPCLPSSRGGPFGPLTESNVACHLSRAVV